MIYLTPFQSLYQLPDSSAQMRLLSANACLPLMEELSSTVINIADLSAHSFMQHFHALREHLQKYNTSLKLDEYFYQNNLLALNIYLRDKSVETLKQKWTSDFWSLVSKRTLALLASKAHARPDFIAGDIGGTLGLFLGASILTVGEIIEYILCQCAFIIQAVRTQLYCQHGGLMPCLKLLTSTLFRSTAALAKKVNTKTKTVPAQTTIPDPTAARVEGRIDRIPASGQKRIFCYVHTITILEECCSITQTASG